ncbi:MAG: acyltransferase family protein [Ruminococcus sp.]|nr:acyltransferase family protein [Ruminococcus sp.]
MKKLLWIDLIKVFSTLLIVVNHSISYSFTTLAVGSMEWKVLNFLFMISRMGLPVFIMCSGAGMLARERTIKEIWQGNIAGLLKVYIGWMAIFGIRDVVEIWINGENASLRVMVNAFLKCILFGKYHTWFIFMLLGLYAVTPLLYAIACKKELLRYFLVLSILFTLICPMISGVAWLSRINSVIESVNMQFVVGYTLYFFSGYFICHCMEEKWEKYAELLFILSAAAGFSISTVTSLKTGTADQEAYMVFSVCGYLMSVSLMMLFKKYGRAERKSVILNKAASLQKYGIAVYLLHVLFVEMWTKEAGMINLLYALLIWLLSMGIGMAAYRLPVIKHVLFIQKG